MLSEAGVPMSTYYEERIEADLEVIRERLHAVSKLIEDQLTDVIHAFFEDDAELASRVILGDRRVNRRIRDIDHLCHAFIVRHSPSAGHLRYVSAVLRLDVALERIGDYASTIGREVVQLTGKPSGRVTRDMELISQQARKTLAVALSSFHSEDVELARSTYGLADQTDSTMQSVFNELLRAGDKEKMPLADIFRTLRILNLLKRVAEQAQNICEQTLFVVAGETKDPKTFRILFVDEDDAGAAQVAKAYARKAYPESGEYSSAGWSPAKALRPGLAEYLDSKGMDARELEPSELRPVHEEPQHYHVIVGLNKGVRSHIEELPFRSVYLEWDDGLDTMPPQPTEEEFKAAYKVIRSKVQDLMHTLRGRDAR